MEKNKKEIIVLIIIICIGVNYSVYNFFIREQFTLLNNKKIEYNQKKKKLSSLKQKSLQIEELQNQINDLKKKLAELDKIAPHSIDTPQLVYDFYAACGEYGVKGENISFNLNEENQNEQNSQAVNQNSTNTGQEGSSQNSNSSNNTINNTNEAKLLKLTIELKMSGNKTNVIKMIENLNDITERRLNVKSMNISYMEEPQTDGSGEMGITSIQDGSLQSQDKGGTVTQHSPSNMVTADIVFYHYIQLDDKEYQKIRSYSFYNTNIGFDSIPDLFK